MEKIEKQQQCAGGVDEEVMCRWCDERAQCMAPYMTCRPIQLWLGPGTALALEHKGRGNHFKSDKTTNSESSLQNVAVQGINFGTPPP